eukprot:snap_masked-scaffold_55-processed-gene-1.29-mRNA-1 protein AED:0.03 eAED:0.03 QI:0/-1/0/1/-1/1/1/0/503
MDDIEDLVASISLEQPERSQKPMIFSSRNVTLTNQAETNPPAVEEKSVIPGTQKIFVETFGCAHNVSDGEYMSGLLQSYGYDLVRKQDMNSADLWLINSCTVKNPSETIFLNLVNKAKQENKYIVVAGCVPQADRSLKGLESVSMLGVEQIDQVVYAVEETLKGNTVKMLSKAKSQTSKTKNAAGKPGLSLPKVRKNRLVEIIPINTGCLGSCTYCKTKHARGKLGSYPLEEIVSRVRSVLQEEDIREVWLASEDTGAYGKDMKTNIGSLLKLILKEFKFFHAENKQEQVKKMLKLGMTNPPYMRAHLDVIADVLNHEHMFKFIHIPVQSGSNNVLKLMRREYTIEEFKQICDYLLKFVPGISIATDIICGFPGETEQDFQETLDLIQHYKFPVVNISKFYPRPGTPAAKMTQLDSALIKKRSRELSALFNGYEVYQDFVGQDVEVWFGTEVFKGAKGNMQSVGHTKEYVKVCVPWRQGLVGLVKRVQITESFKFHILGKIIE